MLLQDSRCSHRSWWRAQQGLWRLWSESWRGSPGTLTTETAPGLRAQRGQSETIHHGVLDKVTLADTGSMNMTITNSLRTIVPTVSEEIHKYDVYQQKNLPLDTEPGWVTRTAVQAEISDKSYNTRIWNAFASFLYFRAGSEPDWELNEPPEDWILLVAGEFVRIPMWPFTLADLYSRIVKQKLLVIELSQVIDFQRLGRNSWGLAGSFTKTHFIRRDCQALTICETILTTYLKFLTLTYLVLSQEKVNNFRNVVSDLWGNVSRH